MSLRTNVVRRGSRYYVRVAVPVDLQARVGKVEIWKSLGTADPAEASRKAPAALATYHAEWEELRRLRHPDEDTIQEAVAAHYAAELDRDAIERHHAPTAADVEALSAAAKRDVLDRAGTIRRLPSADRELALIAAGVDTLVARDWLSDRADMRKAQAAAIRHDLAHGEFTNVAWAVDALLTRQGLDVAKGSPTYRLIAERVGRATLEALARADERDRGDWAGQPRDPVVNPPDRPARETAPPGERITDVYELYAREAGRKISADTINMNRKIVALFAQFAGVTFPVKKLNKGIVRDWKQALYRFPVKAAEITEFKGLHFNEIIEKNDNLKRPTISERTINKYLTAVGAFATWLVKNGYIETNPCEGLFIELDKSEPGRDPFTNEQLKTLFNSPLFVGCQSATKTHLPGNVRVRDHRFWLPLVALFTGGLVGEIAQLHTDDIQQIGEQWCILIRRGEDKRLKTKNRTRTIPVHSELCRLGFIAYVQSIRETGEKRLFPLTERDTRGYFGREAKEFNTYLKRIGISGVSNYSFRHRFIDELRRAGFRDEEAAPMMGHGSTGMTGHYGTLREGDVTRLAAMVDSIRYPVGLSHLYPVT